MAQTLLNLAQGVTGTLPTSNYVQGGGKFGQIVVASRTNEVDLYTSTYTLVTGLTASITPTATSSKVLILVSLEGVGKHSSADRGGYRLTYGGSQLQIFSNSVADNNTTSTNFFGSAESCVYLHSPNSTSSLTYTVEGKRFNSSGALRTNGNNGYSSINLIEILA